MKWLLFLLAMALASCDNGGREAMLDNYVLRLGRAVDDPAALAERAPPVSRPSFGDRDPLAGTRIDLLEFLKLRSCRLQAAIAHRNSSLGKLAQSSQRLLNSVDFLRWVDPCITRMTAQGSMTIAGRLQQAAEQKTRQLPRLLWRAILGAEEATLFWSRPSSLDSYPENTGVALIGSLEQLHRLASAWLAGDYGVSGKDLENHLQRLSQGDGGALLAAMNLLSEQMQRADGILARAAPRKHVELLEPILQRCALAPSHPVRQRHAGMITAESFSRG